MFATSYTGRSQLPSSRQAWHLAEHCRLPVALKAKRSTTIAFICVNVLAIREPIDRIENGFCDRVPVVIWTGFLSGTKYWFWIEGNWTSGPNRVLSKVQTNKR
jgi:hypothetical protein